MKTGRKAGIFATTTLALGLMSPIELRAQELPSKMMPVNTRSEPYTLRIMDKEQTKEYPTIQLPRQGINYASLSPLDTDSFWSQKQTDQSQKPAGRKVLDKKFWGLAAGLTAATIYDIETTYAGLNRCETCREGNPLMRHVVEAGRPASYGVAMGLNAGLMYYSYRLRKSNNSSGKKRLWWLLPTIAIGAHGVAGSLNLRYVF